MIDTRPRERCTNCGALMIVTRPVADEKCDPCLGILHGGDLARRVHALRIVESRRLRAA